MEIRARYVLIGLFVLAVIVGIFGFVFWLNNAGGIGERTAYRVEFQGSIAGLSKGSPVLFNGLDVGEVTSLSLVTDDPGQVLAMIAVDSRTPVRADTHVGLIFAGLTGTATVALSGGTADAVIPVPTDGQPPLLVADPSSMKDMTQAARDVLAQIQKVVGDNSEAFKVAVANIAAFSEALGRNSGKVDGILSGLERLTGGETKAEPIVYDLNAPDSFPPIASIPDTQLAVATPTAVILLDTQRIIVQNADGEAPAFPNARFADNLPVLFQSLVARGFENAGYLKVGADGGDIQGDYKLTLDIRRFRIATTANPAEAQIELSAKVLDGDGKVVDARIFSASEPITATDDAAIAARGLNAAFGKATGDMVAWAIEALDKAVAAADEMPSDEPAADEPAPATTEPSAPASEAPPPDATAPAETAPAP
jgi:phospholipid/cholesterol/gamma-HCH transport system substrate-binding protein